MLLLDIPLFAIVKHYSIFLNYPKLEQRHERIEYPFNLMTEIWD